MRDSVRVPGGSVINSPERAVAEVLLGGQDAARVVIAHRLSTIRQADRIIVLQDGQIAQSGSYQDLMGTTGPFAVLARRQLA